MKKLLPIVLIMFYSTFLFAQTPINQQPPPAKSKTKFSGGIMINPFVSWENPLVDNNKVNNVTSTGIQGGFAYGLLGEFFFNNNYGLTLNPRISAFSTEFKYFPDVQNAPNKSVDRNLSLQYVEVPVCLKMRTNEIGYMKYFVQFGLMPAVKISARGTVNAMDSLGNKSSESGNVTNDVNILMLYLVIGAGVEYNLGGNTSIIGSITWDNGFTNVWARHDDTLPDNTTINSNFNSPVSNISLNIGIKF